MRPETSTKSGRDSLAGPRALAPGSKGCPSQLTVSTDESSSAVPSITDHKFAREARRKRTGASESAFWTAYLLARLSRLSTEGPVLQVCREGQARRVCTFYPASVPGISRAGGWIRRVSALIDSDTSTRAPACPPASPAVPLLPHPGPILFPRAATAF
ncbi:unnamed protein product [Rangifer tarandus platyrhynchus]|uniref:Uncharacterized protein n=1 Tax=Rangifer tarandus platyrhynchus TaxID=3082113 RepID=A0ABN8Y582_RANTA|nr:unnamed protein product [Rangifer tarandus platyrhynchus]